MNKATKLDIFDVPENVIQRAIAINDLDAAVLSVMQHVGITDGGAAGIAFSGPTGDNWMVHTKTTRRESLLAWLKLERMYAED